MQRTWEVDELIDVDYLFWMLAMRTWHSNETAAESTDREASATNTAIWTTAQGAFELTSDNYLHQALDLFDDPLLHLHVPLTVYTIGKMSDMTLLHSNMLSACAWSKDLFL